MGILDSITESISSGIKGFVREIEKEITKSMIAKMNHFKRKLIKDLAGIMIILVALIFLSASIVFFLIEYLHLSKTISFGTIGIILLLIGILIKILR